MAAHVLIVMGVSGVGKSTLAQALAARLGWDFQEGDDFHPAANVEKMRAGQPLTDDDRAPWLARISAWIDEELRRDRSGVVTCSALKRAYRDRLREGREAVVLVYPQADRALVERRVKGRHGHFMPPALLASQFADLEPPGPDEQAIVVSAELPMERQVAQVAAALAAG